MLKVLQIFSNSNFIPQGHCYLWKPTLVWLHVAGDSTIAFSSFSISLLLTYVLRQCSDLPFQGIFWLFCALIIACGTTHLMAVWFLWQPDYWLVGLFKAIAAAVSVYTASKLLRLIPKVLARLKLDQQLVAHKILVPEIQKSQQIETERQEFSQRLSLLVQQTPLAVIEWTLDFKIADWNPAAERIFGYSKSEALERHGIDLVGSDSEREQVNQVWKELLLQKGGTRSTNKNFTKEGREIYCEWYNTPLIDSVGQVVGVASLVQDVTERKLAEEALQQAKNQLEIRVEERTQELKQAIAQLQREIEQRQQVEAALREREEQYRSVVDNVKEVIFQTDANGLWTFLNPAWSEITGLAIADSIGKLFLDYVHPDDRQSHLTHFQPLIEGKKEYCRHEVRYRTNSSSYRWIEVLAQLTFNAYGIISGTCGTLNDITERKQAELALAERQRYLATLVEVQRRLLAFEGDTRYRHRSANPYTKILKLLGQVSGASRVYVFENHWDATGSLLMSQKAEWCTPGIHPQIDNPTLQNLPYENCLPRWAQLLSQDEIITGIVTEFPESERSILEPQGILSILILPLKVNGKFFGFIGFDNCTEARPWQTSEVDLLTSAAAAVSLWQESFLAQKALKDSEARLRKQHIALSELAQCESIYDGNLTVALQEITETVAYTLDVERCSVWLYNDDRSKIHCVDLYELTPNRHCAFHQLLCREYPSYFNALEAEGIIAASDAHTHPSTVELSASYLTPLGITSLLDAPIRLGGMTVGVLCTEHTGLKREWALKEQNFVSTTAYMVSLAMEANNRAAVETALRESEERFRSLVAHIPGVVYRCAYDADRTMEFISDVIEEISGYRASDFLDNRVRTFAGLIDPQDLARVQQVVAKSVAQRQPYVLEYRIIRRDGTVRWVYDKGQGVFAPDGNLIWLDGVLFDTTEYRQTQEELRVSEEQFRQLTENIREVFFLTTLDLSKILYISPAYEEVWDRTTKSLYEQPSSWFESVHPEDRDRVVTAFTQHLQQEQCFEGAHLGAGGAGGAGEAGGAEGAGEAEGAGGDRGVISALPSPPSPSSPSSPSSPPSPPSPSSPPPKSARFEEEYRIVRPDGSERWVWVRAFHVLNEMGSLERIAGIAEDITKRKRAEAEIVNALFKEKELGDLKSRFVSITSHEFRTPLTTIMSTAELLEHYEWTKDEEVEQLHLIKDAVKHMLHLLEDLLFIGTADAGQLQFNPEPLDLKEFCEDLVAEIQRGKSLKPTVKGFKHSLTFVSPDRTLLACMDKKLLRQLLSNLLLNAIKYSPSGGTVQFELSCQGDRAIFQVQDQGIGIPQEEQPRLFEFFYRAKNVGAIAGTGLGLAIVKQCVDLHGGAIALDSEVGKGTRFTVTLPLKNHFSIAPYRW